MASVTNCSKVSVDIGKIDFSVKDQATFKIPACSKSSEHEVTIIKGGFPEGGAKVKIDNKEAISLQFEGRSTFANALGALLDREVGTVAEGARPQMLNASLRIYDKLEVSGYSGPSLKADGAKVCEKLCLKPKE